MVACRVGYEECDDGNLVSGDGCSDECTVQVRYLERATESDGFVDADFYCSLDLLVRR